MSAQNTINQPFRHRFSADDALNLEAVANKAGAIGFRTKGLLSMVFDHLLDHCSNEENHILAAIEVVIDEMDDLQDIKHLVDMALRERKTPPRRREEQTGGLIIDRA